MERILQAGILGSDETLKRYMKLYVDSDREPPLLAGKDRESIIRDFDIMDFIPPITNNIVYMAKYHDSS